ncbi:MAG: GtrA family protein [Alphaproteobacteria bacterium]|nr:MAG: GtrA family protein [Alphaproteobacteria bacterium]
MSLPAPLATLYERAHAAWRERAVALKALSFALVGLINTAVDAAIFFLLLGYATSSLVIANVTAWFVANTGSYVMNSLTTFSAETGGRLRAKDYAGFVGSGLVAVTASTITVVIAARFMPVWAAKAIAILVSFAVNFSITHFVVFRPRGSTETQG